MVSSAPRASTWIRSKAPASSGGPRLRNIGKKDSKALAAAWALDGLLVPMRPSRVRPAPTRALTMRSRKLPGLNVSALSSDWAASGGKAPANHSGAPVSVRRTSSPRLWSMAGKPSQRDSATTSGPCVGPAMTSMSG